MPNMPRKEKASKGKYEGKEYLNYDEAMDYLGMRRSSLHNYLLALGIESKKFKFDRKRYIAIEDVKKIEEVKEQPWLLKDGEPESTQQPSRPR